ncbi:MAG: sulfatase-like hydrolase/transferase [Planctomycetota bacterium]
MTDRPPTPPSPPPNLVLVTADQWRADCLGRFDGPHPVMTPHLDQLSYEGRTWTQCYADSPICMPQRVSMMTGQAGYRTGQTDHFLPDVRTPIDPRRSLPGRLAREAGYQTQAIGKMHFQPARARMGFDHVVLHPDDYVNHLEGTEYAGMFRGHGLGGNEFYPACSPVPERLSHTRWMIDQSIEFLRRRDPESPFFLWLVLEAPHSPFDPPAPYDKMYDRFDVPAPCMGGWARETDALPASLRERRLISKIDRTPAEVIDAFRRGYYGQCTHIDHQLGRLFGELRGQGVYDDTAVLFNSDHGELLGDHGLIFKSAFLRGSGDVPCIFKPPATLADDRVGTTTDTPALTCDLVPTFLELAGLEPDDDQDGVSMLGDAADGPRTVFGEIGPSAMAFDGRHKLIHYGLDGARQLFDLANDPGEQTNLAGETPRREIETRLAEELADHLRRFERPMADGHGLATLPYTVPTERELRATNQCAWRGPLRYGQGY